MPGDTADDVGATFRESLERARVTWSRVPADGATDAIADAVEEPTVGTPIPVEGVSLPAGVTIDPAPAELQRARTGVTPATLGIADYGSIVIEPSAAGEEPASLWPERHVAVLAASDVVPDMSAAFDRLAAHVADGRGDAIIATGPSATADMGELVLGAHGPTSVHVVLVEDR